MESAVGVLVSQFKAYAGSDGSSDTLSRDEFHRLVTSELPNFVKVRMRWCTSVVSDTSDTSIKTFSRLLLCLFDCFCLKCAIAMLVYAAEMENYIEI